MDYLRKEPIRLKDGRWVDRAVRITKEQAMHLLTGNYNENVCSYEEMLSTPNEFPCRTCTLIVREGEPLVRKPVRHTVAKYSTGSCGYHLSSPGSRTSDLYFGSFENMREFCNEMGWKLRRV